MIEALWRPFLLAFGTSLVLVPACRWASMRLGYVAKPREDRWHKKPVALFGGVAIGLSLLAATLVFGIAWELPVLLICTMLIFLTGVVDDVLHLKPSTKLIAQISLASTLLFFNYRLNWFESMTLDAIFTLVWVVGLTNAFNLLDNMDGLCAGVSLIAGVALIAGLLQALSPGAPVPPEVRYLAILCGATAGFLVYNVHPASIFMGDGGSLLLGFSFAAATLSTGADSLARPDVISIIAAPVLVLMIPIFDTTLVTVSRILAGRSAAQGGRDHSSHRLVAIGLSERQAVAVLWLLAAAGGAIGIRLDYFNQGAAALSAGAFVLAMALFAVYLFSIRVYEEGDTRVEQGVLTPLLVELVYKRRVAEVVLDFGLVSACYYAAYRLRFEDPEDFMKNFQNFTASFPLIVAVQMIAFFVVGLYRGVWRHFGLADTLVITRGVVFGAMATQIIILYAYRFFSYSRSVFAIYAILLLLAVTLSRASFRLVGEFFQRQRQTGRRVAIYGTEDGGTLALSQLAQHGDEALRVLGFIDEDPRRAGTRIGGYPVLGNFAALSLLVSTRSVDLVIIASPQVSPERLHNLQTICREHAVSLTRIHVALEEIISEESARPATAATVVPFSPKAQK
ncbi:MAG: glycosyl transferase [Acidobacteriota bacterium]|nr:glycosyl transferase [Acidobacteriota bacterium]